MVEQKSLLANLEAGQTAVFHSDEIQRRVAKVGFDWRDAQEVVQVLRDEIAELEEAIENKDVKHIQEEFGDILFTCVNLARHLDTSVETALTFANQKFSTRFQMVEQLLQQEQRDFSDMSFRDMLEYWQKAKRLLEEKATKK